MTSIEKNVMANVRVIYGARLLLKRGMLALYAVLISLGTLFFLVSVPDVAANFIHVMNSGWGGVSQFIVTAIAHTKPLVQLVLTLCTLALMTLLADWIRTAMPSARQFAH